MVGGRVPGEDPWFYGTQNMVALTPFLCRLCSNCTMVFSMHDHICRIVAFFAKIFASLVHMHGTVKFVEGRLLQ